MRTVNYALCLILMLLTALLATFFFPGGEEQHIKLLQQSLWPTFLNRWYGFSMLGLIGAALCWLFSLAMKKFKLDSELNLGQTALLLASGPVLGSLLGTVAFCFL